MSELEEAQNAAGHLAHSWVARFWLKELPYIAVLALTILGVAYTSVSHQPLIGYWEFLAVVTGLVCVTTGWLHIHDPNARFRMVWTQALHWLAFLVAMNIVLLPDVQAMLNAPATGLTLLMLLALGTFVAALGHVNSGQEMTDAGEVASRASTARMPAPSTASLTLKPSSTR